MAKAKKIGEKSALIIVDVQKDFCPGGALAVPDGDKVVAPLNRIIRLFVKEELPIFASRDWHPKVTEHFKNYGGLWPEHCVMFEHGAEFYPDLVLPPTTVVISKGTKPEEDAYSAFAGFSGNRSDLKNRWDDDGYPLETCLKILKINTLYIGGLATDYCVKHTVLDALKLGFKVYLLSDACRAVNLKPTDEADAIAEMVKAGKKAGREKFKIITTREVLEK